MTQPESTPREERPAGTFARLKQIGRSLKRELRVYQLVLKDERTPRMARILLGLAIGYLLLPFDLIPDFIPILGHLDDVLIVPGLFIAAVKMIPPEVIEDCRKKVAEAEPPSHT